MGYKIATREYYVVTFKESFYYDMVGYEVDMYPSMPRTPRAKRLDFGGNVGQAIFYNEQLMFHGEF